MAKFNIQFSLLVFTVCVGFLSHAVGAPVVKRLGNNSTYSGTTNAVAAKTGAITKVGGTGRAGALRVLGSGRTVSAAKPIKSVTTKSADTARLSVGKYLHAGGLSTNRIQPASVIPSDSGINSRITDLEDKINNIETTVGTIAEQKVTDYLNNRGTVGEPDWNENIFN